MRSHSRSTAAKKPNRFTLYLHGDAWFRLEAIAFAIWVAEGKSHTTKPSKTEAIRRLLMGLPLPTVEHNDARYTCLRCNTVYGAPWCPEHDDAHFAASSDSL